MPIDFSKFENRPEGLTDEMLQDSNFQNFLKTEIEANNQAAVDSMQSAVDKAIADKAIADQKVADLRGQLEKAQKSKGSDDSNAQIQVLQDQIREKEAALKQATEAINKADVRNYLQQQISEYNAQNPNLAILPGAEEDVLNAALQAFRKNDSGEIQAFDGDKPLAGSSGFMTGAEFVAKHREKKPFFFKQPEGSGASGGNSSGGANKIKRADFENLPQGERMKRIKEGVQVV